MAEGDEVQEVSEMIEEDEEDHENDANEENDGNDGNDGNDENDENEVVPAAVVEKAMRLTRQARRATDRSEAQVYRNERDNFLAEYEFRARVREDERPVLVLYPDDWLDDGVVQPERIESLGRAIERPLAGPGEDDWDAVYEDNCALADTVESRHGGVHGQNAQALAEFMSNHYCKRIERATGDELQEFLEEYFPRNAWPSDEQIDQVRESIELVFEVLDRPCPY